MVPTNCVYKDHLHVLAYHLLSHLLWHIFVQLKEELNGIVVLVLPVELLGIIHAQPQLEARLHHVILLCQLHVHAVVLLEERVIQEVLNCVPAVKSVSLLLEQTLTGVVYICQRQTLFECCSSIIAQ